MAGDTSRIDLQTLKLQWSSHSSYAAICTYWTVTRDQLIRLRCVLPLPPRHDRKLRHRPQRAAPPSAAEIAASEASLDLAPAVAARVTCVQVLWDDRTRAERHVQKPTLWRVHEVRETEIEDQCDQEEQW